MKKWVPLTAKISLNVGDRVRWKHPDACDHSYVVIDGTTWPPAVAVSHVIVTNPPEWEVLQEVADAEQEKEIQGVTPNDARPRAPRTRVRKP